MSKKKDSIQLCLWCHYKRTTRNSCTCSPECNKNLRSSAQFSLWEYAKNRAKLRNLEFNLTLEDTRIPECCPVFGLTLQKSIGIPSSCSPTLDRIDNSKGYIKGNVAVISYKANKLKNNATLEELESLVEYVRFHLK